MFKYHLCIIIILYKRERCAARARCMGAGGLRTRTSTNVSFFPYLFLSPKYILLIIHFFPFIYSCKTPTVITDAAGGSRILLCAPLLARAHEPSRNQCYIQYFLPLIAAFLSTYSLRSSAPLALPCALICPYSPVSLPSFYNHSDFSTVDSRSTVA